MLRRLREGEVSVVVGGWGRGWGRTWHERSGDGEELGDCDADCGLLVRVLV